MSIDRQFMYEQRLLSDAEYQKGNIIEAYMINQRMLDMDPDNQLLIVNCMGNALKLKNKNAGKSYYEMSLKKLSIGQNIQDYYSGESNTYLMPWTLQYFYFSGLMESDYYEEAAEIMTELSDFYRKVNALDKMNQALISIMFPNTKEVINDAIRGINRHGYNIPLLDREEDEYYPDNKELEDLMRQCAEERNYNPITSNYNDDKDVYIFDKRTDLRNVFFNSYLEIENPEDLYGGAGVFTKRAVMVCTSIEEANKIAPTLLPRKTTFEEILKVLDGPDGYGEIVINPAGAPYIAYRKELIELVVETKNNNNFKLQ